MELIKLIPGVELTGWQMKHFGLMYSSFEEVLMLDTDNLPLVDPAFVFDLPQYQKVQHVH